MHTAVTVLKVDLTDCGITSLDKLQYFEALQTLVIDHNNLTSMSHCPSIPTLKTLWCNNNQILNLSEFLDVVLKKFPNLQHLSIMRNPCTPSLADLLVQEEIEKEIGNQFEWRGALQPLEILAGCGSAVADELINIDQSVFPYFQDAAKALLAKMGPEKSLCAALARISGFTERPKQKSLLNAQEGMITIMFHSGKTIPSNGYVYGALMKSFSYEVAQSPKGM
jgi:hypothetical protein